MTWRDNWKDKVEHLEKRLEVAESLLRNAQYSLGRMYGDGTKVYNDIKDYFDGTEVE